MNTNDDIRALVAQLTDRLGTQNRFVAVQATTQRYLDGDVDE
ncbi:hypothetical protein ACPPVQ_05785 [Diaminobutyricibacter sp. McL0618]